MEKVFGLARHNELHDNVRELEFGLLTRLLRTALFGACRRGIVDGLCSSEHGHLSATAAVWCDGAPAEEQQSPRRLSSTTLCELSLGVHVQLPAGPMFAQVVLYIHDPVCE